MNGVPSSAVLDPAGAVLSAPQTVDRHECLLLKKSNTYAFFQCIFVFLFQF